jgi:hypothetical protein
MGSKQHHFKNIITNKFKICCNILKTKQSCLWNLEAYDITTKSVLQVYFIKIKNSP